MVQNHNPPSDTLVRLTSVVLGLFARRNRRTVITLRSQGSVRPKLSGFTPSFPSRTLCSVYTQKKKEEKKRTHKQKQRKGSSQTT